jgi:hypothetical protein
MQLTAHFSVGEYTESDTAIRLGINNSPMPVVLPNLKRNAELMELIRAELSKAAGKPVAVFLKSGYRCEELERVVAHKDFMSWCDRHRIAMSDDAWRTYFARKGHPKGNCADWIAPAFGTPAQIVKFLASKPEIMAKVDQIICEGTWVHTATADNPRSEVMTASFDENGVPSYSKGIA